MDYKKLMAAAAAVVMLAGMTGCGKDATDNAGDTDVPSVSDSADKNDSSKTDDKNTDDKKSEDKAEKTTKAKDDSKEETTTTKADSKKDDKTTTKASGSSSGNSGSSGSGESGNGGSEGEVKTYDAEITLGGSHSVKGSNASVDGKVVRITAGGDYRISGKAGDAQIYVSTATEEKVTLVLDGVDIACSDGPAININEAKRCTIKLAEGSSNYLRDGGTDKINDGVIFSNDTVRIKGSGSLEINSGNAHGIASDDDVIIENGKISINSIKSGIFAHDDITVNDGDLYIKGGTNGMKSKGTVNINGGKIVVSGGSKEEKSSIYAATALYYTGGKVFAAGNKVTAPASTPNPYIVASLNDPAGADTEVKLYLNGGEQISFRPHNEFRCILMMTPDISEGKSFKASLNGNESGESSVGGGQNIIQIG